MYKVGPPEINNFIALFYLQIVFVLLLFWKMKYVKF